MEPIQRRIDFSRSIFLVASWGILGALAVVIIVLLGWVVLLVWVQLKKLGFHSRQRFDRVTKLIPRTVFRATQLVLFLVVVCYIARFGYVHAEEIYNERAFGYFASHIRAEHKMRTPADTAGYDGLYWMVTSAEYAAVCRQIYHNAGPRVVSLIEEIKADSNPPAVVMDLDETVLDNMSFNLYLLANRLEYSRTVWEYWNEHHADEVRLVPGAEDFIKKIRTAKAKVIFISNRYESQREVTLKIMQRLEILGPTETVEGSKAYMYLYQGSPSKEKRRENVADNYTIVSYVGDNLADHARKFEHKESSSYQERREKVLEPKKWPLDWIILPNTVYGDWKYLVGEKERKELLHLRSMGTNLTSILSSE